VLTLLFDCWKKPCYKETNTESTTKLVYNSFKIQIIKGHLLSKLILFYACLNEKGVYFCYEIHI